jgi:hypothetical protein
VSGIKARRDRRPALRREAARFLHPCLRAHPKNRHIDLILILFLFIFIFLNFPTAWEDDDEDEEDDEEKMSS